MTERRARIVKRARRVPAVCAALLLSGVVSFARASEAPLPAGDDTLRMQLRLSNLGYDTGAVSGVFDAKTSAAYTAFCKAAGVSAGDAALLRLFAPDAPPAPFPAAGAAPAPTVTGAALPWNEARNLFAVGETYPLAAVSSGIVLHIRFLGGEAHGECTPASAWDEATLFALLDAQGGGKLPVAVTLNGTRVAASLSQGLSTAAEADEGMRCSLYLTGAVSSVGGLPDAEHDAAILAAAGG